MAEIGRWISSAAQKISIKLSQNYLALCQLLIGYKMRYIGMYMSEDMTAFVGRFRKIRQCDHYADILYIEYFENAQQQVEDFDEIVN